MSLASTRLSLTHRTTVQRDRPGTDYSDTFDRADEDPVTGWTHPAFVAYPDGGKIVGHQLVPETVHGDMAVVKFGTPSVEFNATSDRIGVTFVGVAGYGLLTDAVGVGAGLYFEDSGNGYVGVFVNADGYAIDYGDATFEVFIPVPHQWTAADAIVELIGSEEGITIVLDSVTVVTRTWASLNEDAAANGSSTDFKTALAASEASLYLNSYLGSSPAVDNFNAHTAVGGAGSTDAWGGKTTPDFQNYLTDLPCRYWVNAGREQADATTAVVVEDMRLIVPLGIDITEQDRLGDITYRGSAIVAGPIGIRAVLANADHLELVLVRLS